MRIIFSLTLVLLSLSLAAQKPKNGVYTYTVAFAEWNGESHNATCTVIVKGDSIKIVHNGTEYLSGNKGDIIDEGIIVKHKSGVYIVAHSPSDKNAASVGGCTGISEIDFRKKIFWLC